jgi:hypothetical protein
VVVLIANPLLASTGQGAIVLPSGTPLSRRTICVTDFDVAMPRMRSERPVHALLILDGGIVATTMEILVRSGWKAVAF